MTSIAARYSDLLSAVAGCCERLVTPSVQASAQRARLSRLVGSLAGASFLLAGATALVAPAMLGAGAVLACICATLAGFWLAAITVASGKAVRPVSITALAVAAAALPALIAAGGGFTSPLLLILPALAIEPCWAMRNRGAAIAGGAAFGAAALLLALASAQFTLPAASGWLWIPTVAYLASLAARFVPVRAAGETEQAGAFDVLDAAGMLAVTMSPTGEVLAVKGRTRDILGVPAELLLGTGLFDRILVGDRVRYLCALGEMRDGANIGSVDAMIRLPREEGVEANAAHRLFTIRFHATPAGIVALLHRDGKSEALRGELIAAQERCAGMAVARNRLLASVSHELRTPLNAIIGFSDMLLLELFGQFKDARQKEYVTLVRDSGHHLLAVVNSILDVSRLESGAYAIAPEPFRLGDAIDMCGSMMAGHAKAKQVALKLDADEADREIVADRRAVQQMLINLVSNAIKFTPDGGEVVIGARLAGSRMMLTVSDNGIGIAAQDLDRLGEPFTQIHNDYTRQFEGTGLGLSLVKGLVALHGGEMTIESAPGEGTCVTIALPLAGPEGRQNGSGKLISLSAKRREDEGHGGIRKTA